jgi:hypothetical protein
MYSCLAVGCREGRTATKQLPNLQVDVLVDQLAAVAFTTGQTPEELRVLIQQERQGPALYTPRLS